jgi:hypothetical protein
MLTLAERADLTERMDVEPLTSSDAAGILDALETINYWFGGLRATLQSLRRFSRRWTPGETVRLLDLGTGGADTPRAIVRWARRNGFSVQITGIDNNAMILSEARRRCAGYPEIELAHGDALAWEPAQPVDYVISSLTMHHLPENALVPFLRHSDQLARRGIVMNDLIRSARAWTWIWILSRIGGVHPMVQADGPTSVRRAFKRKELSDYARQAGLSYLQVETFFGYRQCLAGEKI